MTTLFLLGLLVATVWLSTCTVDWRFTTSRWPKIDCTHPGTGSPRRHVDAGEHVYAIHATFNLTIWWSSLVCVNWLS